MIKTVKNVITDAPSINDKSKHYNIFLSIKHLLENALKP